MSTKLPYVKTVTKRRIAVTQMRRAILLYREGDFICSLTLAGAAEEILGKMVAQRGHSSALDDFATRDRKLWEWAAKREPRLTVPPNAELRRRLNCLRNDLKHNDSGTDKRVVAIFDYSAEEMLLRCIRNYLKLYGKPPRDKVIADWLA
ncbi:MAG TPA: hypothetical protein VIU12_01605 [Chryseolinea sp.]